MLETGIRGRQEERVEEKNSAFAMGSGQLYVFATPAMVALMEKTAWMSVAEYLDEGYGTVGVSLDIRHLAATPLGMNVYCETELIQIEGRKLTFSVKAFDETGIIGEGNHERFIVENGKFQQKADAKSVR
ncbi:MAG: thioesterase family protein [Peptostreptococcaceae bacterium]|nr:thioesterase family protein [Peptostreptococcaceae bacterium]